MKYNSLCVDYLNALININSMISENYSSIDDNILNVIQNLTHTNNKIAKNIKKNMNKNIFSLTTHHGGSFNIENYVHYDKNTFLYLVSELGNSIESINNPNTGSLNIDEALAKYGDSLEKLDKALDEIITIDNETQTTTPTPTQPSEQQQQTQTPTPTESQQQTQTQTQTPSQSPQ